METDRECLRRLPIVTEPGLNLLIALIERRFWVQWGWVISKFMPPT